MAWRKGCLLVTCFACSMMIAPPANGLTSAVELSALYWPFPPFVYQSQTKGDRGGMKGDAADSSTSILTGGMYDMINGTLLSKCFSQGSVISNWYMVPSPRVVHENRAGYDIIFPVSKLPGMEAFSTGNSPYKFIPFVQSAGACILRDNSKTSSALIPSVLNTWPLGLGLICTAVLAGLIIWLLETRWNPDGFPRPFLKGLWEGVWWAWVTMSTVGYGDKTPMTIPGRIFAFVWIMVGIIFMSIFTATVTAAISMDTAASASITGNKVGTLNGTTEEWLALSHGADVTVYNGLDSLLQAVTSGDEDAILLDSIFVTSKTSQLTALGISLVDVINAPCVHGIYVRNMTEDVVDCLHNTVDEYRYDFLDEIKNTATYFKRRGSDGKTTAALLGDDSLWTYIGLGSVLGLVLICFIAEAIFVKCLKTKDNTISTTPQSISKDITI